jgi:membrane protein DedA with SNARE-associated domain
VWGEVLFERHGLVAAFVLLLLDDAGVIMPLPGNVLVASVGVLVQRGLIPWWQAVLVLQAASLLGTTALYGATRWAGRGVVYRHGHRAGLSPARLDRAERWLHRYGPLAIIAGRLIPGLRVPTTIACGVLGLPLRTFLPSMAVGALLYVVFYALLGYLASAGVGA